MKFDESSKIPLELIGYIQFVGVEEQDDPISSGGEPPEHLCEVVAAVDPLLLSGENTCGYAGVVAFLFLD